MSARDVALLAAIAIFLLSFTGPGSPPDTSLQSKGSQALDRGDYQQAEQIFSQLVAADPKDYFAYFNLALAEVGLKKDDRAIADFKQTLALKPGLYQAQLNLGLVYLRDNQAGEAIPLLEAVVSAKPDDAKLRLYLAQAYQESGKWPQAGAEFTGVLKRDAKNARASLGVAEALLHQGKLDEAKPYFEQAVQLDASLKRYLLEYAVALAEAGRNDEALPLLVQFPNDAGACAKVGQLYLSAHQPARAAESFESALRLDATPANRLALATAYLRSNQEDKAAPLLKEALAASPNDWELQMTVGRIYRDQKKFSEAAAYFFNAAKLKPSGADAWSELAGVLTLAQQYPQALGALDKLHELNAEKPGHFYLRAIILDKLRQLKPALVSYQQFLRTSDGKNPDQEFQARGRIKALQHEVYGR
jgi:tetratricopeptide (TPR) repeat protein